MSDIDYIRRPEPIVAPQIVSPVVAPVPIFTPTANLYSYDASFGGRLLGKFGTDVLTFNQLDDYANAIPLALSVMLLPLLFMDFRCKVYKVNDTFLWAVILLFGGIGQRTLGFLEWCKEISFTTALYLTY